MHEIDFLPIEYRQQHAQRQVKPWRIVVVAAFVMLLATAEFVQHREKRRAENELATVESFCADADRQNGRSSEFETQARTAESDAELLTYLRHPWPRTQLLTAVANSLPREIQLLQIQIGDEAVAERAMTDQRPRGDRKAEEDALRKTPAAERDLKRLQDECDKTQTFVRVAGTTTDTSALYRYLGALSKTPLISKVEIRSVERIETPKGAILHFQADLLVLPGYGQVGGPDHKSEVVKKKALVSS